ncbi:MAG: hypothetical protein A2015_16620 [Spirochaetes bacterium GWF1_31_7]|nr:MAG: hypothetical protein A2Y30_13985 [Spirochaetes bacterium GWE1_32_154]OHD50066.1 MAG: hypothetical protein A2Y29_12030 [Spirochaetes bacterium GWE2_31_10]OHD52380.1 MAG: hypothetical protein A2015_16620 [Spirochaetes bacterium GWF1_31_7]OHD80524.1 MAG: hypothetical protein A2355_03650 [Spirochaetes bacterium RIFOXYB1_FULL_32_8]HBD96023.1 hypothetical protein [Spirochaetia bacterium]
MNEIQKNLQEGINNFNRKSVNESIKLFEKVLESDPMNPEANYYLGLIYSKDKRYDKSVLHLKVVVDMGISFIFTHQCRMILGYIYYQNDEFDRAEYEFTEVLKANFNITQVHAALSAVYYKKEMFEKAFEEASKAYTLDNFNINAKNTYGFLLCDLGKDPKKGVEILREVVRLKPDNPAYLDSLGWAYYKNGDVKAGIASLRMALDRSKAPEIQDHYDKMAGKKTTGLRK